MRFSKNGLEFISFNNSEEHKEFVSDLLSDQDVRKYIPKVNTKIKKKNPNSIYENGYIVKNIDTNELIGFVYFGLPFQKEADINYAVHPDYRLEGYGKRILKTSSEFILEKDKSVDNIVLIISPDNLISQRAAQSVGFSKDGNIRYIKKR